MKISNKWLKIILPPLVIIGALLLSAILVALKPEQERKEPAPVHPKIEAHSVVGSNEPIVLNSEGTVRPRQQTRLTSRVSGHIEAVSPDFYEGGSFQSGDILLRLDPLPYKGALAEAEARLALAEATLAQEREASEQARLDWESIGSGGSPSPLVLRKPQLMKAEAELKAAKVALEVAQVNLDYTEIRAPYDGRVDAKFVDVGQAITGQATILGEIHSSNALEVPVPLSLEDFSFIGNPEASEIEPSKAILSIQINGIEHQWNGFIERTSASVNSQSRMITAIIRAQAPFTSENGMKLRPGMFVKVEIQGKELGKVLEIPRNALHPGDIVYRLTEDKRLESRKVEILYTNAESAVISGGIEEGDQICLTPLLFFVEGMHVQLAGDNLETEGSGQ
ncbi:efflux RND transporter periplasmic adaptor subunit [Puniceicoccales bacterium CK1056]|uniref:Efflux RND transporter periplasmic adaptor subunit n=1 Tax=Oceanipulchritudo coccoides TaxID=2706888 RepID=A0A6B2LZN2_9BACT|nr:efflux RND transporter periplasmic adaptor subunit [Oceanipulchritudo coccoides]NDV61526.1 efflux RND transporter periplasmic adaptor subunit [Oceanipulchritudo coccoides]